MKKYGKVLLGLTASAALIGGLAYFVKKVLNPEIVLKDLDKTNSNNKACKKNANLQDVPKDIPKVEQMSGAAMIKALAGELQNTPDVTEEHIFTLQEADKTSSETLADATKKVETWKEELDAVDDVSTKTTETDSSAVDVTTLPNISKTEMMQNLEQNMSTLERSIRNDSKEAEAAVEVDIEFFVKKPEIQAVGDDRFTQDVNEPANEAEDEVSNLSTTQQEDASEELPVDTKEAEETEVEKAEGTADVENQEEVSLSDMIRDVNAQNSVVPNTTETNAVPNNDDASDSNTIDNDEDFLLIDLDEED